MHKSGIVLLAASWETYIEELIKDSLIFILNTSLNTTGNVHQEIAATILTNMESKLKNFNTPNSGNILNEFRTLGISDIRNSWGRRPMNSKRAVEVLDELLANRHKIVHGHLSDPSYKKSDLKYYKHFLEITAQKTDDYVRNHLHVLTGTFSW